MSKNFMIFMFLVIVFTILIFAFPDFFSKGLDYLTEENEPYIFIGLIILIFVISFIKRIFFMRNSEYIVLDIHTYSRQVTDPSEQKLRLLLWLSKSNMPKEPIEDENVKRSVKNAIELSKKIQSYCSLNITFDYATKELSSRDFIMMYRRMDFVAPDKFHVSQDTSDLELGEVFDEWVSIEDKNFQFTGLWMPTVDGFNTEINRALKLDRFISILQHNRPINQEVYISGKDKYLILEYQMPLHEISDFTFECPEGVTCKIYLWIDLYTGFIVKGESVFHDKNDLDDITFQVIDVYACHNEKIEIKPPMLNTTELDEKGQVTIIDSDIILLPHYTGKYTNAQKEEDINIKVDTTTTNTAALKTNKGFPIKEANYRETFSLKRWLQIIIGVLFLPIFLLFIIISLSFIVTSLDTATSMMQVLLTIVFGSIILLGSLWFTNMTIRYILNKPRTKTLDEQLPPWALYLFALYFLGIPTISILTGVFFEDLVRNLILLPIFIGAGIQTFKYAKFKSSGKHKK